MTVVPLGSGLVNGLLSSEEGSLESLFELLQLAIKMEKTPSNAIVSDDLKGILEFILASILQTTFHSIDLCQHIICCGDSTVAYDYDRERSLHVKQTPM